MGLSKQRTEIGYRDARKDTETFKYEFVNCGYGELRGSDNKIGIGPVTATP